MDPNVLGRTVRLDALCDDFEDTNWHYDYQEHTCYRRFWQPSGRGEPKLLKRVTTPSGGKQGSTGALEIRTNYNANDRHPDQKDLQTAEFEQKLGRKLTRADQPVFIVHVWVPPFDQWTKGCDFGFRHASRSNKLITSQNKPGDYYPSIWLRHPPDTDPWFWFRIGHDMEKAPDRPGGPIKQPGWWTLALAFDEKGVGHYYTSPGVDLPTEKDRMLDTTQFKTTNGTDNPIMDYVGNGFFTLGYPKDIKITPQFVIDDYDVWVVKR